TFAERARSGSLRHVGLGESLHLVAHRLGLAVASYEETLEPIVAERETACGLGPIRVGHAAGVAQVGTGRDEAGTVVARLEFRASVGEKEPHDRVKVTGEPPVDLVIQGGVHGDVGTSAMVLNSIRPLLDAAPGLHTMTTIRLPGFDPGVA